jgi:steroid 5-alpha reductase family enzyme
MRASRAPSMRARASPAAAAASLYPALMDASSVLGPLDCVSAFITAGSIVLEASADRQMDAFARECQTGKQDGGAPKVMNQGLWGMCRHPNYLGELLFWWGLFSFAAATGTTWSVVGPASMTALFVGVSVGLMERRQKERRGAAFERYMREVPSALIPGVW